MLKRKLAINLQTLSIPLSFALLAMLAGCHGKPASPAESQVAARVNGDEITIYQINRQLQKSQLPDAGASPAEMRRVMLDGLVDQQLLVQAALKNRLDRAPDVMQDIEAARRDVLAQAYMRSMLARLPEPTDSEVGRYRDAHPELFADRQVYRLQELVLHGDRDALKDAGRRARGGTPLQEIAASLRESKSVYSWNEGMRAAEQLPPDVLAQLQAAKKGQTIALDHDGMLSLIHVEDIRSQPIGESEALPRIRRYLMNASRMAAVKDEVRRLRKDGSVEYAGEFSGANVARSAAPAANDRRTLPLADAPPASAKDGRDS